MRTTLDLDDDVLQAAKELAALQGKTAGQMVSELVRRALRQPPTLVAPFATASRSSGEKPARRS